MQKINFISGLLLITIALADQNIEIIGGNYAGNPKIAIVNFSGDGSNANNVTDIISNDLNITGEFSVKEYSSINAVESSNQYIITGTVESNSNITYQLMANTGTNTLILNQKLTFKAADLRRAGHLVSNGIYHQLTNSPGIFTSKIAYITQKGSTYKIIISDYDGYNQKVLVSVNAPLTSLAWDKSGKQLAYVSFESGKPVVYVQDLYQAKRYSVANFSGSNSSPSFTPNSSALSVTLTKDDGSHIYLVDNSEYKKGVSARSLISFGSIDTEANIASNESTVFTSNHDGGPQIFMSNLHGMPPVRLTINLGNYNTTPRFSHDLSKITFINRNSGTLKTYVLDLATHTAYPVSIKTNLDLSPSFAPNDKLILFSSDNRMYIVNTTGTSETKLNSITGEIIIDQSWANNF